jgi:hypothetical protein
VLRPTAVDDVGFTVTEQEGVYLVPTTAAIPELEVAPHAVGALLRDLALEVGEALDLVRELRIAYFDPAVLLHTSSPMRHAPVHTDTNGLHYQRL